MVVTATVTVTVFVVGVVSIVVLVPLQPLTRPNSHHARQVMPPHLSMSRGFLVLEWSHCPDHPPPKPICVCIPPPNGSMQLSESMRDYGGDVGWYVSSTLAKKTMKQNTKKIARSSRGRKKEC